MPIPNTRPLLRPATGAKFKLIGYSLLVTGILLTALFLISPLLLAKLINWQLAPYALYAETKIERIKTDNLVIPAISMRSSDPNVRAKLSLQNLRIDYDALDLILTKSLHRIDIETLTLYLEGTAPFPSPNTIDTATTTLDLLALLPDNILPKLAVSPINIENVVVHWQRTADQLFTLNGQLSIDQQAVTFSTNYQENEQFIANADLRLSANNEFAISASNSQQKKDGTLSDKNPSLSFKLTGSFHQDHRQSPPQLSIATQTQINTVEPFANSLWLSPLQNNKLTNISSFIEGEINIKKQITTPAQLSDLATWLADSSVESDFNFDLAHNNPKQLLDQASIQTGKLQLAQVQLKGSGNSLYQHPRLEITINPTSRLDIQALTTQAITADKLSLTLASQLSAKLSIDNNHALTALEIDDFSSTFTSDNINSRFGRISHQPIHLKIADLDLANQQVAIAYQSPELQLTPTDTNPLTPFTLLKVQSQGSIKMKQSQINARLNANSVVEVINVAAAELSTDQIIITNTQPIAATFQLGNKKLSISDHRLSLTSTPWSGTFGELKHSAIDLEIAAIDIAKQALNVTFEPFEAALQAHKLPLKSITLKTSGSAAIKQGALSLSLDKGLQLQLKKLNIGGITSGTVNLRTTTDSQVTAPLKVVGTNTNNDLLNGIRLSPLSAVITGSRVSYAKQQLDYQSLSFQLQDTRLSPLRIRASSQIKQLSLSQHPSLKQLNISATHKIDNRRHRGTLNLHSQLLALKATAKIDSRNQYKNIVGSWQLSPVNLAEKGPVIAKTFQLPLPNTFNISAGKYQQQGKFNLKNNNISASASHKISDLSIDNKELAIAGINSVSRSHYNNNQLSHSGKLKIAAINHAIAINNISANFSLKNALSDKISLSISKAKATMLEAKLAMDDITIPLKRISGESTLHFSQLPLNNVLALEQQPSLTGTGTLAGKLPFKFIKQQLWISNGDIHSTDHGYIRYHANDKVRAFANTNAGLEIALNVLEDFHYNVLSIKANYTPNGDLTLRNKLSGKNPNWQNGQPIEFAINIEENVLQLLKALQISDQLTEKIQKKAENKQ